MSTYRVGKVAPWAEAALGRERLAVVRRCRAIASVTGRSAGGPWIASGTAGRFERAKIVEAVNLAAGEVVLDA